MFVIYENFMFYRAISTQALYGITLNTKILLVIYVLVTTIITELQSTGSVIIVCVVLPSERIILYSNIKK